MPSTPKSSAPQIAPPPHVALLIETSKIYGREILAGIGKHIQLHRPWSTYVNERGQNDDAPFWLSSWKGDGIITRTFDMELCRQARDRGIAVVSLRTLSDHPDFPSVFPDQEIIGQRVALHLIERGFQHFGYVAVDGRKEWERLRRTAFTETLKSKGFQDVAFKPLLVLPTDASWEEAEEETADWLRTLPKPVGIMVTHDVQGLQLLDACRRAKLRVPDEVAVVSVDNDPVLCDIANPPLSSLDQDCQRIGFEAAAMLDKMMLGEEVAIRNYFIEPGYVVVRQSSDVIAVADERLSRAIRFIRENAYTNIDVQTVARVAGDLAPCVGEEVHGTYRADST